MCFLNKMDRMGANFWRCVDMIKKQLETTPLLLQLPIGVEAGFVGVVDLVEMTAVIWENEELGAKFKVWPLADAPAPVDDALRAKAAEYRAQLVELAVEQDEEALLGYLEGVEPSIDKLKECIRKGTLAFAFTPVITGTAFKNKGVQTLLDAVVDYMPSPLDRPPIQGVAELDPEQVIERPSDDTLPFAGLAFKLMNDPFVGTLTFTRVYSGVLKAGTTVRNTVKGKSERIGRMLQVVPPPYCSYCLYSKLMLLVFCLIDAR